VIVGVGLDLAETARIAAAVARWGDRFTARIFTDGERAFAAARREPAMHLAARFAAKEAVIKALGGPPGVGWREIEVVGGGRAAPALALHGRAAAAAAALAIGRLHLSLTHTRALAAAVVVAESG
jgi:holo-[acyl-carrier protein] synthase